MQTLDTAAPAPVVYLASHRAARTMINIEDHIGLVKKIAWHVYGSVSRSIEISDLVQTGMIALIEAARTYEIRVDATFVTYATIRVRGAMIDCLRRQANVCRSGMIKGKAILQANRVLQQRLGRPATQQELAKHLGMSTAQLDKEQTVARGVQYEALDAVYSDHIAWFADDSDTPEQQLESKQLRKRLADLIAKLPTREAQVLQLYFVEELNLHEIGELLGIKAARVCQIKKSALDKLRGHLVGMND